MRVLLAIQARSGSSRFPGKVYELIGKKSVLEHVFSACEDAKATLQMRHQWPVRVAVIGPQTDVKLKEYCEDRGWPHLGGSETDLLTRYVQAANLWNPDAIVRITSDCWCLKQQSIVEVAEALQQFHYAANTIVRSYPEGQDCQGCRRKALDWFDKNQKKEREHPFYPFDVNDEVRQKFVSAGMRWANCGDLSNPLFQHNSIDSLEDLNLARAKYAQL